MLAREPEDKMRNSPVRLSNKEKYMVYKYAIEQHCIIQDGADYEFRVSAMKIAKEINNTKSLISKRINSHHILQAVSEIVEWQEMMGKLPAIPQETAELEQLRIELNNAKKSRDSYKEAVATLQTKLEQGDPALVRILQNKLEKIKNALID